MSAHARNHTYVEFENLSVDASIKALKAAGYIVVTRGDCWVIVDSDAAIAIRNIIWKHNNSTYCLVNTIDPDVWDAEEFVKLHCPG